MKTPKPHTHAPYHLAVRTEHQHLLLRRLLVKHYRTTLSGAGTHQVVTELLLEMDHATLHCDCHRPQVRWKRSPYLGDCL